MATKLKHRSAEAKSLKNYKPKVVKSKKVYSRKRACIEYAGDVREITEELCLKVAAKLEVLDG